MSFACKECGNKTDDTEALNDECPSCQKNGDEKSYIIFDAEIREDDVPVLLGFIEASNIDEAHMKFLKKHKDVDFDVTFAEIAEIKSYCHCPGNII